MLRSENSNFNLANFMRTHIYSAIATLKIGMEILEEENVNIDKLMGHGGLFKTKYVGQKLMAGAMKTPVSVCHLKNFWIKKYFPNMKFQLLSLILMT